MNEIISVTTDTFKSEVLEADRPVLVDFWARWSGPCRMMEPFLDEAAEELSGMKVCRVDVEREPKLVGLYRVAAAPTLMVFDRGRPLGVSTGSRSRENIVEFAKEFMGGISHESDD